MKRIAQLMTLSVACLLAACSKDDEQPPLQPVAIRVSVAMAPEMGSLDIPFDGAGITITNIVTGQRYTETVNAGSTDVSFSSVVPGTYDIAATLILSAAAYETATGIKANGDIRFSGTTNTQTATSPQNNFSVALRTGGGSDDWVIKQIYYAGSDTKDGAVQRDQFLELYNNSDHVLYADSLYISQVEGVSTALTNIDFSKGFYLPYGQWDWSKSAGMAVPDDANTDYIYAASLFRIPGNGQTYPVQPGQSIIIASTAINHKAPYQDNSGEEVTVRNPELTVDLSNADFDVYMGDQPGINPLASDLNTGKPHLAVILNTSRDLVLDNPGRGAVLIFRTSADPKTAWRSYKTPDNLAAGKLKLQMPRSAMTILDVMETQPTDIARRCPKRISLNLDAGYNYVTNGSYSSQALIRKTDKMVNGRAVLLDTNNSTVDFITIKADPSKNAFAN